MQKVEGSNPFSRLRDTVPVGGVSPGALAEWLRSGLQSRLHRFDSGRRLAAVRSGTPSGGGFTLPPGL